MSDNDKDEIAVADVLQWDEVKYIESGSTISQAFPTALKQHDTEDAQGGILSSFGTVKAPTTLRSGGMTPQNDTAQQFDKQVASIVTSTGVVLMRETAAKAVWGNKVFDASAPVKLLEYDANRKIARIWITVAKPILLGSQEMLMNYINPTVTQTGATVQGVGFIPGTIGQFQYIYGGVNDLWVLGATIGPALSAVSYVSESYGGMPGVG